MDQKFLSPVYVASVMDQKFLTPVSVASVVDQTFLTPFREASDMDQKFLTPTNMYNIILLSVFNFCNFVIQSFMFSSISSTQKLDISLNLSDFNLEMRKKLLF